MLQKDSREGTAESFSKPVDFLEVVMSPANTIQVSLGPLRMPPVPLTHGRTWGRGLRWKEFLRRCSARLLESDRT